ncbi:tetratricopeptide repeat protein [Motiliproteus sp. SC1-56]|uniref:tetratricopeptide repeat protein n=1 Tax=Motiliproteus sp. SC1-56 TaxID=2799565 RepID=UPI001A8D7B5D|nr:tetratricopeptide repeat protein [Motiliproteus sp. SC1-56]
MTLSPRFNNALLALTLLLAGCSAQAPKPPATPPAPAISPTDRADFDAAVQLMNAEDYEAAEQKLEALLQRIGDTPGLHLNLALIDNHRENNAAALAHVQRALSLAPEDPRAHNLEGSLLRRQGAFLEARRAYEQALALDPDYPAAHLNLAILCDIYLKQWTQARHHYQRYLALAEPADPRVNYWLQDLEMRIEEPRQ